MHSFPVPVFSNLSGESEHYAKNIAAGRSYLYVDGTCDKMIKIDHEKTENEVKLNGSEMSACLKNALAPKSCQLRLFFLSNVLQN